MTGIALRPWQRLSGSTLKWAAIVTMFLDHLGATLVWSLYEQEHMVYIQANGYDLLGGQSQMSSWYSVYLFLRTVGRIAFPIFCFLLAEGFFHTRSRGKYALRLGVFCLISEIPFDIAFNDPANGFLELGSQNVFFTLLLGFLAMWVCESLPERWPAGVRIPAQIAVVVLLGAGAELLETDYGLFGVCLIAALYWGRRWPGLGKPWQQAVLGSVAVLCYCCLKDNWIELWAVFGLLLTLCYDGRRGRGLKWFFYFFYPVHLLALGLLNRLLF